MKLEPAEGQGGQVWRYLGSHLVQKSTEAEREAVGVSLPILYDITCSGNLCW